MHWLRECLDNISGGNVRRALDLVKEFFGSGHVDTEKIVKIFSQTRRYLIPQHEFLRAVIYGDAIHYNPEKSPIANIFDVSYADPREHFLMPLLLAVLTKASGVGVDDGFVETVRVYEHLQGLGFVPDQIDACLIRAHRFKLVEFSARRIPQQDRDMPHAVRATSIGAYHLQRLCGMFTYIDAMTVDTPIFDLKMRAKIGDVRSIGDRLKRGRFFLQYLDKQWVPFEGLTTGLHWSDLSENIEKDIVEIETRLTQGRQGEFASFGS